MNTNTALHFLGWAALTYMWLNAIRLFFTAIADAIHHHNEEIRLKAFEEANELLKENDEDESEDGVKMRVKTWVNETTVTEII